MRRGNRYALWAMFWATLAAVLLMYGLGKPAQKYVRLTGGSNANSGATYALAWATFGHACSTAVANDTVNIAPGTWTATMGPSGGLNGNNVILHPLHDSTTFRPIPDSATPVLDGSNYANDGIVVLSLQHVNILNLRVTKCNYPVVFYNTDSCLAYGLNVYQNILQNNDNIGGIMLYSVTEDTSGIGWNYDNAIKSCTLSANYIFNSNGNEGGIICYWQYHPIVENCYFTKGDSIGSPSAVRFKNNSKYGVIRNNRIKDYTHGYGVYIQQGGEYDSVYGNVIEDCLEGINIVSAAHAAPQRNVTQHIYIYNNTVYGCTQQGINCGDWVSDYDSIIYDFNSYKNLVISCTNNFEVTNRAHTFGLLDSNCYWNPSATTVVNWKGTTYTSVETYSAAQGYDENSVQVYPVFTDTVAAGGRDFHLTETSPTSVLNMGAYPYSEGAPKSYTMIKK